MEKVVIDSPVGKLGFCVSGQHLQSLEFLGDRVSVHPATSYYAKKVSSQLYSYFEDPEFRFTINYEIEGTDYQKRVWRFLRSIPSGSTLTYKQVSEGAGGSPRSVGNACRANPIPILTPCHRVIAGTGLGGFSGKTQGRYLNIKKWLLGYEKIGQE